MDLAQAEATPNPGGAGRSRMESVTELEDSLLEQPWASVRFDQATFMAKASFRDSGYALLISDLSSVWYESADAGVVGQRAKELNKRLTAHVSSFLTRLRGLVCPLLDGRENGATSFSCQRSPSQLTLHVKSELSGLPLYWDFRCALAPAEMISRHLVRPLMGMSLALQCHVRQLVSLLLQKNAEIEDYRESGAALSRGRLRTEPFEEESFLQTFVAETLPAACHVGDGRAFTADLQQLYVAVCQQEARAARKRHRSASGDSEFPKCASSPAPVQGGTADSLLEPEEGPAQAPLVPPKAAVAPLASPARKAQPPVSKAKRKKTKGLFG
uniref:Non-homologous end-joining factor 1 n=2 Tax=Sphenodon punctatus TaxID=8508 RepID=A0A8D0HTT3_SPHPU